MPLFVRWCRIAVAFILGAGYTFGPEQLYSSPSFDVVKQSFLTIPGWGVLFMSCAVLMAFTKMLGVAMTVGTWLIWGTLIAMAPVTSWGALVWPYFFVAVNAYELSRWGQNRVQLVREEQITSFLTARQRSRQQDRSSKQKDGW